jgi:hypothetical protein
MAQPGNGEGLLILWSHDHGSSNFPPRVKIIFQQKKKTILFKIGSRSYLLTILHNIVFHLLIFYTRYNLMSKYKKYRFYKFLTKLSISE